MAEDSKQFGSMVSFVEAGEDGVPHASAHLLSTARACLAVVIRTLSPKRVWVPFYTCNTTYQPFVDAHVPLRFYAIDKTLRPLGLPEPAADEYILYTNYFGLCDGIIAELQTRFGSRLIIDDTHGFFAGPRDGLISFNSARKFLPVPDGACLYMPEPPDISDLPRFESASVRHLDLARAGDVAAAKHAEIRYELSLDAKPRRISVISETLLSKIDLAAEAAVRKANFAFLHARLAATNTLQLSPAEGPAFAFIYPYLPEGPSRRSALRRGGVDLPMLWWEARTRPMQGFDWERDLATNLLPLPIDGRQSPETLNRLCHLLQGCA